MHVTCRCSSDKSLVHQSRQNRGPYGASLYHCIGHEVAACIVAVCRCSSDGVLYQALQKLRAVHERYGGLWVSAPMGYGIGLVHVGLSYSVVSDTQVAIRMRYADGTATKW